jgi:hypothetical protein
MLEDLKRRIANYGEVPSDFNEEVALTDLQCNANLYTQEAKHIAKLDPNQIKILSRSLDPIPAVELAPPSAKLYLEHFDTLVERTWQEMELLRDSGQLVEPHWDPGLKKDKSKRFQLYQRLFKCGLITFRRRQKARVGMFAVKKKGSVDGNTQRLIVDCRQSNSLMRRPPTTRLATSAGLASLDFSTEALAEQGYEHLDIDPLTSGLDTGDVGDCFYNFVVPNACSWFSTGDIVDLEDMRRWNMVDHYIYDEDSGITTPLLPGERVYICFRGMPMGWSWALYFAQEIISHQCLLAVDQPEKVLIRDKHPAPAVRPNTPVLGVYVDNVHSFGGKQGEAAECMDRVAHRFSELGIPFTVDHTDGQPTVDTLGLTFSFGSRVTVRAKQSRAWRLWGATRALLRRRRISGDILRVWLGHVNFHFMLSRPLLSILSACYKFSSSHLGHRFPMWPSVRKEMKLVLSRLFTVERDLSSEICPEVHVGDSSDRGYSLMCCNAPTSHIRSEMKYQEKWRFLHSDEPCNLHPGMCGPAVDDFEASGRGIRGCLNEAGVGSKTRFGQQLKDVLQSPPKLGPKRRVKLFGKPLQPERTIIEAATIPGISDRWKEPSLWDLIVAKPWHDIHEHINVKEARVCLLSLRRLCRTTSNLGKRCLTLSDSMVSILALTRGRSSSSPINNICRRSAAYQIAGNISWHLRHIVSADNPADGPSRLFGEDVPKGKRMRVDESLDAHVGIDSFEQGIPSSPSTSSRIVINQPNFGPKQQFFLELFAGSGNLSHQVGASGLRVYPPFEFSRGRIYGLLDPLVQSFIFGLIAGQHVWWIHLGTPCTTWSRARHGIKNHTKARRKEQHAVATALFTCKVIRLCLQHGVNFTLENPKSSRLWEFEPLRALIGDKRIRFVHWDMCQYGEPHKKSTSILTNQGGFAMLGKVCTGGHKHVGLQGTVRVKEQGKWVYRNRTYLAGAYPTELCECWAQAAVSCAPPQAFGKLGWRQRNEFIAALTETTGDPDGISQTAALEPGSEVGPTTADRSFKSIKQAASFLRQHPVVFGQFTKTDIAKQYDKFSGSYVKEAKSQ